MSFTGLVTPPRSYLVPPTLTTTKTSSLAEVKATAVKGQEGEGDQYTGFICEWWTKLRMCFQLKDINRFTWTREDKQESGLPM